MSLTRMEIHGYRGFRRAGVIDFAVPNGSPGSGLTVLTGPNNAGKSSILEGLRARAGSDISFTTGTRNREIEAVQIKYVVKGKEEVLKSAKQGSSETVRTGIDSAFQMLVLPSRRAFNPFFGKSEYSRDQYVNGATLPPQRSTTLSNFESRLFKTNKDPAAFNALLDEALGYVPSWTIDQSDQGQYFLKFSTAAMLTRATEWEKA